MDAPNIFLSENNKQKYFLSSRNFDYWPVLNPGCISVRCRCRCRARLIGDTAAATAAAGPALTALSKLPAMFGSQQPATHSRAEAAFDAPPSRRATQPFNSSTVGTVVFRGPFPPGSTLLGSEIGSAFVTCRSDWALLVEKRISKVMPVHLWPP